MASFGPIKRRELVSCLRRLGFDGPYAGGKHQFMSKGELSLIVPNPHRGDIGPKLLGKVLRQGNISREEWEKL